MKGKIISCILVVSLPFNTGCYSREMITGEELRGTAKERVQAEASENPILSVPPNHS